MLNEIKLSVHDKFKFGCTQCGACCQNRNDILLNTFDLYRMADKFKMSIPDILNKYMSVYIGDTSKIPIVSLNMRQDNGKCPFLNEKNQCGIHDISPTVCYLYPLGRHATSSDGKHVDSFNYFIQPVPCGNRNEIHTVESWIRHDLEQNHEEFLAWQNMFLQISDIARYLSEQLPDKILAKFNYAMISAMYLNYEGASTDAQRVERMKKNTQEFVQMFGNLVEQLKKLP